MEKPWKVIAAFVGVFIAGSIFGGLLALRVSKVRDQQNRMVQVALQSEPQPATTVPPAVGNATTTTTPGTSTTTTSATTVGLTTVAANTTAVPAVTVPATTPAQGQPAAARPVAQVTQPLPATLVGQAPALMRRYMDRLDLTPEQKEHINPTITRASKDLVRQQQTNNREIGFILQHMQEDINRDLTAPQRVKLDEMIEKQRAMIEAREKEQQDTLRKFRQEQQDKRMLKQGGKDVTKPKANVKPPEDGN